MPKRVLAGPIVGVVLASDGVWQRAPADRVMTKPPSTASRRFPARWIAKKKRMGPERQSRSVGEIPPSFRGREVRHGRRARFSAGQSVMGGRS
jgi:hypothetical protein